MTNAWDQSEMVIDGKTVKGGVPVEDARAFYSEVMNREEQIKELKEEQKAAMDSFARCNNMTTKGIQRGIKEYKQYLKDQAQFRVETDDADRLLNLLVGDVA